VRRAVCNLCVYRKVNRQYKHNLSCTVHYHRRPYRRLCEQITVRRHFTESFIGNATIIDDVVDGLQSVDISQRASLEMPQSPMTVQTDSFRRHFTESGRNGTITDDFADGVQSVGISRQFIITDKFTDGRCKLQKAGIKCISNRVPLPTELPTACEKYVG